MRFGIVKSKTAAELSYMITMALQSGTQNNTLSMQLL